MLICADRTNILGKKTEDKAHAVSISTFPEKVKRLPESVRSKYFSLLTMVAELARFLTSAAVLRECVCHALRCVTIRQDITSICSAHFIITSRNRITYSLT